MASSDCRPLDAVPSSRSGKAPQKRAEEKEGKLEARLQQARKMESVDSLAGGATNNTNNMTDIYHSAEMANPFHF